MRSVQAASLPPGEPASERLMCRKKGTPAVKRPKRCSCSGISCRDLASNLPGRIPAEKCALCVFTNTPACERMAPPCYNGVEQYLLKRAAAYHQKMEVCCKAYFAYLDELQKQGGYSQYEAEDALKAEFPWLSSHEEYAKYAIASWIQKYWA